MSESYLSEAKPQPTISWTDDEERRVRRATDFKLLSFIILCFLFLQFDRTNLGNALTGGFKQHLGITQNQINIGQTLFTSGIVVFELPSNLLAKRIGPNLVIPFLMVAWGAVTLSQGFLHSKPTFYATRFLLAAFESGFIPGMAFYISRFYRNGELGLRYSFFWAANNIAGIISGIIALGLLSLNGKGGLAGWQYLFVIEGALTLALGVVAFLYFPYSPSSSTSRRSILGRRSIFSQRQFEVIKARTLEDDPLKAEKVGSHVTFRDIIDTLKDWQIIGHCASAFLSSVMLTPMNTYAPSLVKSLGFAGYSANGLQSPGSTLALIVSLSLAWNSDRTGERGFHIAAAMTLSAIGSFWLALPHTGVTKGVLYAGVVLTQGGMGTGQGMNAAWLASRLEDRKRPVGLALYVMSIQLAGFAGANVFKASDAPRYRHGLIICGSCALSAGVVVIALKYVYLYVDAKKQKHSPSSEVQTIESKSDEKVYSESA